MQLQLNYDKYLTTHSQPQANSKTTQEQQQILKVIVNLRTCEHLTVMVTMQVIRVLIPGYIGLKLELTTASRAIGSKRKNILIHYIHNVELRIELSCQRQ